MALTVSRTMLALLMLSTLSSWPQWADSQTQLELYNPMIKNYNVYGDYFCQAPNYPCESNGDCCSGCCQEAVGLCSSRNSDCVYELSPCSGFNCPLTTRCYVQPSGKPYCVPEYSPFSFFCQPQCPYGFQCKTFTHVNPPYSKCIVEDPCGGKFCPAGLVCEVPLPNPFSPKCVPDPCMYTRCRPGMQCRLRPNAYPARAQCVPEGPCARIRCANGFDCVQVPGSYPPQGRCVLSQADPCLHITCDAGSECQVQPYTYPLRPECVFKARGVSCSQVTCRPGYLCVMQVDRTPPTAQCEPARPCMRPHNPCPVDTTCWEVTRPCKDKVPCPPTAECHTVNPCASTSCGPGHSCYVTHPPCYAPPCLPVAECVLTTPCAASVNPCRSNEFCAERDTQCLRPPCPRAPVCYPKFW